MRTSDRTASEFVYRAGATPWDIGGPQPAIQQLVALGGIKGAVLDPGTGPGHHAILYASHGYPTTAIDVSPTAIDRALTNAAAAGVAVDFRLEDATQLQDENAFDTVVDAGLFHRLEGAAAEQYLTALHRATRPGARLYLFEYAPGEVNRYENPRSLSEAYLRQIVPAAGFDITYLGTTAYQLDIDGERIHAPYWQLHATRARDAGRPKGE